MTPQRIHMTRTKGFRLQLVSHALNGLPARVVHRGTIFGNPFPVDFYGQQEAVDLFREWLDGKMSCQQMAYSRRADKFSGKGRTLSLVSVRGLILKGLPQLRGHNLACYCAPALPCHADVYLEILAR